MPRYFFTIEDGHTIAEEEGEELANDAAAHTAALEIAGDLTKNNGNPGHRRLVVRSRDGAVVCKVPLAARR